MLDYHDREWGVPVHDDRQHFEFLVLEAAQAGLSWSIVLKKREGYRRAFSQFDPRQVARYTQKRIQTLTADPSIIRNRMKIDSAVRLAVRRRTAPSESVEGDEGDTGDVRRIRRVQQGSQAARIQLRRFDHHVRAHAGGRHGERPPPRLFQISRDSAAR